MSIMTVYSYPNYSYLAIKIMMRIGSLDMVKVNIARGAPNARNVQPKNSIKVIFAVKIGYEPTS
jgi:hypothetical protein